MPRVTYVKRAQQRYETKPVIDPDTGQPKRSPMLRKDGTQITTKRGPKFLRVTERDLTKPLPNPRCDFPGCTIDDREIKPGTAYKWIKPKSGPYGGSKRYRHAAHPNWQVWEYSQSLDARLAQVEHDATEGYGQWESADDVTSAASDAASEVESLADEWDEKASNVEEGFGHETSTSTELSETADGLRDMAQSLEDVDVEDAPDRDDFHYDEDGEELDDDADTDYDAAIFNGEGESYESALDQWREEALSALQSALERNF